MNWSQRKQWRLGAAAMALLLTGACSKAPPGESETAAPMATIAHPALEGLEPALATAVESRRDDLEDLVQADGTPPAELAQALGELGRLYQAHRLLEAAHDCYQEAHSLDPGSFDWAYYLGVLSASSGEIDDAAAAFDRALELHPGDLPSLIRLADLELERGDMEKARGLYARALELNGSSAAALYGLGRVEIAAKNLAPAIEYFNQALAIQPTASVIHYHLGQAYRQLGEVETAEAFLSRSGKARVAMADPLMHDLTRLALGAGPHMSRGNGAMREGRFAEAAGEYRQAVEADPKNPRARQSLGSALARLGELEQAATEFQAAVRLEPSARAHSDLGVILAELGDDEASLRHLRKATELEPGLVKAQLNLANALARLGQFDEAITAYGRLIEADPNNAQAHLTLADLLVRRERIEEALTHYRRARELQPPLGPAWIREATVLMGLGRFGESRDVLQQRLTADPSAVPAAHSLARLLASAPDRSLRDGPRALDIAARLLEADNAPQNAETAAMALAEVGRFEEALQIQRALVAEAQRLGRSGDVNRLTRNLALYEQGNACCARPGDTLPPY